MNTIRAVVAPIGFAHVLDGGGGIRATLDVADAPWPQVPEPALIVLNTEDARTAAWTANNVPLAASDRDALLGPIRRTWAAAFDEKHERVAVLVLEGIPYPGTSLAEGGGARAIVSRSRLILLGDLTLPTPMIDRVREALRAGKGPRSPVEVLI